jgi:hypothetical protein
MENKQNIDHILNSIGDTLKKIRLENEYNGEFRILQSFSRNNKTVYYTRPFQEDLDKLIKSKTGDKQVETERNLLIHKLNENSKYIRPGHPKN